MVVEKIEPRHNDSGELEFVAVHEDGTEEPANVTMGQATADNLPTIPITLSQDNVADLSYYEERQTTVGGDSWYTIFDLAEAVDILYAVLNGDGASQWRITWDDGTTDTVGTTTIPQGYVGDGAAQSGLMLPPTESVAKLEFINELGGQTDFGFQVATV